MTTTSEMCIISAHWVCHCIVCRVCSTRIIIFEIAVRRISIRTHHDSIKSFSLENKICVVTTDRWWRLSVKQFPLIDVWWSHVYCTYYANKNFGLFDWSYSYDELFQKLKYHVTDIDFEHPRQWSNAYRLITRGAFKHTRKVEVDECSNWSLSVNTDRPGFASSDIHESNKQIHE